MSSTKKTIIKFTSKRVSFEYFSTVTNSANSKETLLSNLKRVVTKFLKFLPLILKNITHLYFFWTLIKTYVFFR